MDPKSNDWNLMRKGELETEAHAQRAESHLKAQVDIGETQLQAKEGL